ncbi:MAG: phytanoyl-CoA dioxygenase family protein, partial [Aquihabitans sp.]
MRSTFFDEAAQASLERDGYAVIDLLDADEVARLDALYDGLGQMPADPQEACIDTFYCPDIPYKNEVDAGIGAVIGPHLDRLFDRQHVLSSRFINKWPGENSGFGLHQDISLVDEREHTSVELWCALEDTDEENGQLWVVPGSHTWRETNRGIHRIPPPFWSVAERIVARHGVPVPLQAGQAVVFNHATYHFSYANRSDRRRLVAAVDLRPEEAEHLHYLSPIGRDDINVYAIRDSFWVDVNPFNVFEEIQGCEILDTIDYEVEPITEADLDQFVLDGRAVDHPAVMLGPIKPTRPWCHRSGGTH